MAATTTVPIVFITPGDPVQQGLVASLNRPGGNLTGVTITNTALTRKQIELVNELLPGSTQIAILSDPTFEPEDLATNAEKAGQSLGRRIFIVNTTNEK
jgi:putative ABC transport system substrate-binding protein